jgi:hypothetical protein
MGLTIAAAQSSLQGNQCMRQLIQLAQQQTGNGLELHAVGGTFEPWPGIIYMFSWFSSASQRKLRDCALIRQ